MKMKRVVMFALLVPVLAVAATLSAPSPGEAVGTCYCTSGYRQTSTYSGYDLDCAQSKLEVRAMALAEASADCYVCSKTMVYTLECAPIYTDRPIYYSEGYMTYRCYSSGCIVP